MIIWKVQQAEVVENAIQNGCYIPNIYKSEFLKNVNQQVEDGKERVAELVNLYKFISSIYWERNTIKGIKPGNSTGICFGFAGDSGKELFSWNTIDEFGKFILSHMSVIDSLWNEMLFNPKNVVLKIEVNCDPCPIDINDWQYLMPPFIDFSSLGMSREDIVKYCKVTNIYGFTSNAILSDTQEIMNIKQELKKDGVDVNVFESKMNFSEFKLNSDGLIPVVVQDYKTNEVLMLAYMNEEAFDNTIKTGRMTYYSRSRKELWIKGLTSGHYQYVKSLSIDCDNDTLLAKVKQIGAACHTGKRSCFYTELVKKEYDDANPLMVFEEVFNVIKDRKANPKEGSYTNYLFDKGIDKILKKVGEEATEIVIAAKNPDKEEIKYEISDFLYHVMVLMAEKEVSWEDITRELARR